MIWLATLDLPWALASRWFATGAYEQFEKMCRAALQPSFDREGDKRCEQQPARFCEWFKQIGPCELDPQSGRSSTLLRAWQTAMILTPKSYVNILITMNHKWFVVSCFVWSAGGLGRRSRTVPVEEIERVKRGSAFLYTSQKMENQTATIVCLSMVPSHLLQAGQKSGGSYSSMAISSTP